MKGPRRALVIGEALMDVLDGAAQPGGSPLNVAVGLSRLGIPTRLHTSIGTDDHGESLLEHLKASGVELTESSVNGGATSVAHATWQPGVGTAYSFSFAWNPQFISTSGYDVVHIGSLGTYVQPGADLVEAMLADADGPISFDPNIRPSLIDSREQAVSRVERLVQLADIVKASEEDLAWLYPSTPTLEVIDHWAALGPKLVVATRGAASSISRHGGLLHVTVPHKTAVVDTIGAGDAFMAGLLASVLRHGLHDVDSSLAFATQCAAIAVGRAGANPPWQREIAR